MEGAPSCAEETEGFTTIVYILLTPHVLWSAPSDRATATGNRAATATEVYFSSSPSVRAKINTPLTFFTFTSPYVPFPNLRKPARSAPFPSPSVFGVDSLFRPLILLEFLHSMYRPTETPSPPPTIVGYDTRNEEQSPSPGGVHHTGPITIAIDGEGGIPFVQRVVAQGGPTRPGEGESQSSVSLLPSTDIHISFQ